jgi:ArsR family transcriptional regulator, zinc-responsive transcriptional repressor
MRRAVHKKTQPLPEIPEDRESLPEEARTSRMNFNAEQFRSVAFLSKGLSDENRLRILLCVSGEKKSVSGIVEELGLSQPLVSHHLKELKRCLMVTVERSGPFIYYGLTDSRILDVIRLLDSMAADFIATRKTI